MLIRRGLPCKWCSSSDAMAEYTKNYFCFSCGKSEVKKEHRKFFGEEQVKVNSLAEYENYDPEIPDKGLTWLYKYGITDEEINNNRIGWYHGRVVFPLYKGGVQARRMGGDGPKYLTHNGTGVGIFYPYLTCKEAHTIIVVEDVLSAIKVSRVAPCVALCGTKLKNKHETLLEIVYNFDKFVIWLDGDKAGQDAAAKLMKQFKLIGTTKNIKTKKDPKCYSTREIKLILKGI